MRSLHRSDTSEIDTADLPQSRSRVEQAAKLVVVDGPDVGRELPLDDEVVIGSDQDVALSLSDCTVSRRHAAIHLAPRGFGVRDLGSRNGTYVGETRIVEASLALGSVIRVGNTHLAIHPAWRRREIVPSTARRFGELRGESVAMRETFAILERACRSDVSVLIEGETGTGKELAARALHYASPRAAKPLVIFDCAAVPPNLAESELFGHVRGAFSGATSDRAGAFERAHGGTLVLDEMGELPLSLQPKLLRVLESGDLTRVGGNDRIRVDVRVVAATNRDLHAEVQRGSFRADLLYRLDVVKVKLPPLRTRPEDLEGLVAQLLMGRQAAGDPIEGPNLDLLASHSWPGNVRELRNVLQRAVTMAEDPEAVRFRELVFNLGPPERPSGVRSIFPGVEAPVPFKDAKQQLLAAFERAYVDALLERHGHNLTRAAEAAGLSRKHLYELLRRRDD